MNGHDRQTSVEGLNKSAQDLQTLIDSIADYAILTLDPGGRVTSWSRSAEKMTGYKSEDILGKHFSVFYTREDSERGKPQKELQAARAQGRIEEEGWRIRKDGTLFWASVVVTALHGPRGEITGFGKVVRNMSKHKWDEEDSFAKIFSASPAALSITTVEESRFVEVNEGFCRLTGYTRDELIGRTAMELNMWPTPEARDRFLDELHVTGTLRTVETSIRPKSGTLLSIVASFQLLELGSQSCILAALHDISDSRKMEEELRQANRRLSATVTELQQRTREITMLSEMANLLQSCVVPDEAYRVVSTHVEQLFPAESGALYIMEPRQALELRASWGDPWTGPVTFDPEDCWALRRGRVHSMEDHLTGLVCNHMGSSIPSRYLCVPMVTKGETLGILHLQSRPGMSDPPGEFRTQQDQARQSLAIAVAEHIGLAVAGMRLHETLRVQSTRDPLTNLFNRRYMEESLDRELHRAARNQRFLSLLLMDGDGFKKVNDTLGHEAGDAVLRELARLLASNSRKEDIACRYGGDEFTLVIPEASIETACERAELIRKTVAELVTPNHPLGQVTLSFGIAGFPDHGDSREDLLRAADGALYRAKAEGGNRIVVA